MNTTQRPLLLNSALALSTIGSGISTLAYLAAFIFYKQVLPRIEQFTNIETPNLINRFYVLSLAVFALVSFVGVLKMWQFKKAGFFFYLTAQAGLWGFPLIFIGIQAFSSTNTIFTLLFLFIYIFFFRLFK